MNFGTANSSVTRDTTDTISTGTTNTAGTADSTYLACENSRRSSLPAARLQPGARFSKDPVS